MVSLPPLLIPLANDSWHLILMLFMHISELYETQGNIATSSPWNVNNLLKF